MKFETGNLNTLNADHPERKNWFAGAFIPEASMLHTDAVEIKWAKHTKGIKKTTGMNLDAHIRTVVILISGKWRAWFHEAEKEIIMSEPGDYIVYDTALHDSEALEDSHIVVVRWNT